jgi:hypothetical protein
MYSTCIRLEISHIKFVTTFVETDRQRALDFITLLQTFTQDDKLITIPNSTNIFGIAATSDNIIVGEKGRIHCLDTEGTYLRTITLSTGSNARYLSIGHNNQIYYTTPSSINCVNWDGTEVFSYKICTAHAYDLKLAI